MYNLVPYSRSALFLRRPQPDPLLETRPRWSGDAARASCRSWGGGHSQGTAEGHPVGNRSGATLRPRLLLTQDQQLQQGLGQHKPMSRWKVPMCRAGSLPFWSHESWPMKAGPWLHPCQVKDADLPRSLAVSKAKYCREGARGGKQHQQGMLGLCNGWQLPGWREALPRRRRSRRQRSEVPDSPGGMGARMSPRRAPLVNVWCH